MKFESKNFNSSFEKPETKEFFPPFVKRGIIISALSIASYFGYQKFLSGSDYTNEGSFNAAFKKARANKENVFYWKNNRYTTELVAKEVSDNYIESKKFLEEYYSSDYYKSKYKPTYLDSLESRIEINKEIDNSPRYKELMTRFDNNEHLSRAEIDELNELLQKASDPVSRNTERFNEKIDSIKDSKISEKITNLNKPIYFSLTQQKGKQESDGVYSQKNDKIFIYNNNKSGDEVTSVHELTHKATKGNTSFIYSDQYDKIRLHALSHMIDNTILASKYDLKIVGYMSDPTEIDARQNAARFWLYKHFPGYTVNTPFTEKHYHSLKENYEKLPYDIQQLMDLFQEQDVFISNMNTY